MIMKGKVCSILTTYYNKIKMKIIINQVGDKKSSLNSGGSLLRMRFCFKRKKSMSFCVFDFEVVATRLACMRMTTGK